MGIDVIPIWFVFIASIFIVMLAIEAGYRLGKTIWQRSRHEKESPISAIAGTILGLAAFMLAFAFGVVWDRYDARKSLVREDAIAIRTAWRRSDFLPEADRAEARDILRRYVDLRLAVASAELEPEMVEGVLSETKQMHDRLWSAAVVNARKEVNSEIAALYVESLNTLNTINVKRVALGIQARVPIEIWLSLYCITILGMIGVGYQTGIAESRRSIAWPLLALAFSVAFGLIASLDRPDSGILKVPQTPLIELQNVMEETVP